MNNRRICCKGLLGIYLAVLCMSQSSFADEKGLSEEQGRKVSRENKAVLRERSQKGNVASILELGRCGDQSDIAALKTRLLQAKEKKEHPTIQRALRKAIAKLGDKDAREEIKSHIKSDDLYMYHQAMQDAAYVSGNDMIISVAQQLFDERDGGRPMERDGATGKEQVVHDVSIPAPRHAAVIALSEMIEDPSAPRINLKMITYDERDVEKWRKWWEKNKKKYEEGSEEVKEEGSEEVKEEGSEEVKEEGSEEVKEEGSEEVKEEGSEYQAQCK
jgi:hypothetical protein